MWSSEGRGWHRRQLLLATPSLVLAGCGFQLRGAATLQFQSIALTGFTARSPLAEELRVALQRSVTVLESPAQAQVVFHALREERLRRAVTFTASGQVRDIQLRLVLKYRAETPAQRELIPDTEILLIRELSFVESKALGKEQEAQQLYAEMQSDIVLQLLLRLSTVRLS
jgi:LPS-assembly lipoprotein